ncbi:hypothetical protein [Nonomuraea rhizosphaerae]|uniref:hypothetical protein n=1 Tax=Nonomuraea rhizosphaerae TaxID=2665663 RepID=UPI001FE80751|nr:hypothetical protein [Nonomuraea rhizosphaerae]
MADSLTRRSALIAGNTPAGSASVNTVMNAAVASATSPRSGSAPALPGESVNCAVRFVIPRMLKPSH